MSPLLLVGHLQILLRLEQKTMIKGKPWACFLPQYTCKSKNKNSGTMETWRISEAAPMIHQL